MNKDMFKSTLQKILKNGFRRSSGIAWRILRNRIGNVGIVRKTKTYVDERNQINFFKKYVAQRALVFDVGANMGNKVDVFLKLQCRVIAIEPQSDYAAYLRVKYVGNSHVLVEQCGLGSTEGESIIHISSKYPGFSSLNSAWQKGTKYHTFDKTEKIHITTLDTLIEKYGLPDFCKIDVEGSEPDVLAGLSTKIPMINFEFHSNDQGLIDTCLKKLTQLGYNKFNFVLSENPNMALIDWCRANELSSHIRKCEELKKEILWGDVYAK